MPEVTAVGTTDVQNRESHLLLILGLKLGQDQFFSFKMINKIHSSGTFTAGAEAAAAAVLLRFCLCPLYNTQGFDEAEGARSGAAVSKGNSISAAAG